MVSLWSVVKASYFSSLKDIYYTGDAGFMYVNHVIPRIAPLLPCQPLLFHTQWVSKYLKIDSEYGIDIW